MVTRWTNKQLNRQHAKRQAELEAMADRMLKSRAAPSMRGKANSLADPIFVTSGARPDGSLIVHEFATVEEATAAGFGFVAHGRR